MLINQLKSDIPKHPKKLGSEIRDLELVVIIILVLLDVLGELGNKREFADRIFIDDTGGVIDEE
jgi:hypothetical protein